MVGPFVEVPCRKKSVHEVRQAHRSVRTNFGSNRSACTTPDQRFARQSLSDGKITTSRCLLTNVLAIFLADMFAKLTKYELSKVVLVSGSSHCDW